MVSKQVLLVEDDGVAAKVAEKMMSALHYRVDVVSSGKAAVDRLKEHIYQLILLDIGLPDMQGVALIHRIRREQWQNSHMMIPIVGLTAGINQEMKQRCLDAGMNMIILKPLKKETAVELLATFMQAESTERVSSLSTAGLTEGAVLDLDAIKALLKDDALIKECRELMIDGLSEDLLKLANWYKTSDWESIQAIAHKWQGGSLLLRSKAFRASM